MSTKHIVVLVGISFYIENGHSEGPNYVKVKHNILPPILFLTSLKVKIQICGNYGSLSECVRQEPHLYMAFIHSPLTGRPSTQSLVSVYTLYPVHPLLVTKQQQV